MTYNEIKNLFNFDLPHYFERHYESFLKWYKRNELVLSNDELDIIKKETNVDDKCINVLKELSSTIQNNDNYHIATLFFIYVTTISRKPWQNYVYSEDILKIDDYKSATVCLLFVAKQLVYNLVNNNPPYDLNKENLDAFRGYSTGFYEENGYWGIPSFNWVMQCAGGCMFMFGALKFCPSNFTGDFPVLTNGKEYVTLAGGVWGIDKKHRLTFEDRVATTVFEENDDEIVANVILRNGDVEFEPTHFDKKIWKNFLREDYPTLDIHIPSKIEYTKEVMFDAYKKALDFYATYYPNHKIRAVAGYSWLFAPELKEVLKESSKILEAQKSMHLIPTLGTYDETCEFIREGSSMYNNIKNAIANGSKFHYGIMYIPVDEIK